jgi:hypothetical protein
MDRSTDERSGRELKTEDTKELNFSIPASIIVGSEGVD